MYHTALLLIDFQNGFEHQEYFGGNRNNPDAEVRAKELLDYFRQNNYPVIHTIHNSVFENSPLRKGQKGNEIMDLLQPLPNEKVVEKSVNSAFIGTDLQQYLQDNRIGKLVIGGLVTNHCVSTTARMAANYGYEVTLVADATAAFDSKGFDGKIYDSQLVHEINLASLNGEFGTVRNTADIIGY